MSHGPLATTLASVVALGELTALYFWYQHDQRKLRWIHELYWARNQRLGRFFRDEYDGEVESEFNGRRVKFSLAQPLSVILAGQGRGFSNIALGCRAVFEFSIVARCYDSWVARPLHLQGREVTPTGDPELDAEFLCRTTTPQPCVSWLRETQVRSCVVELFDAGAIRQLAFTEGFLEVTYRTEDMAEDKVDAALSLLESLAVSLERVMPPSAAG